ncbi:MAG: FAD-binding oxidoreductase [Pseudomonadota bacterium]
MRRTDILVIGGGIVGLVAGIDLAENGATVRIVDAGLNAGTTTNAGSLHVQMQSRFMQLYPEQVPNVEAALPFYKAAADLWAEIDRTLGPFDFVRQGGLMLAETDTQLAFLEGKARREAAKGLRVEMLDRAALDRIAPWLGPHVRGAELCRDEGKLNPLVANSQMKARAAALGIDAVTDRIDGIDTAPGGLVARGMQAEYRAGQIVLAAAWGAGDLARPFGTALPTRAEPLHMNVTEAGAPEIRHLIQHAERSITLKQLATGQIVIGGGWSARDRGRDSPPAVKLGSFLGNVGVAGRLVPSIRGLRILRSWAGMNTTMDGASAIGRLSGAPRIVAAIPGDAGYTLGPLVGRMAGAIAQGRTPPEDPAPFSPDRFAPVSA